MSKGKIAVLMVLIFLLGGMAGSFATRIYVRNRIARFLRGDLSERRARLMERLSRELHLTLDQRREVEAILADSQEKLRVLRREHIAELRKIFDDTEMRIRKQLTPEQQEEMDRLKDKGLEIIDYEKLNNDEKNNLFIYTVCFVWVCLDGLR